jgi:predicted GNAT superfamily acetyltransferase
MARPRNAAVRAQVLVGENVAHIGGLKGKDLLFAHIDDSGQVDTYAFVLYDTRYKTFLAVPTDVPLIGNCNTRPDSRGRGLYPAMLRTVCSYLAARGHETVVVTCSPDNNASIRGIVKAGFRFSRHVSCWVALSRIPLARRTSKSGFVS